MAAPFLVAFRAAILARTIAFAFSLINGVKVSFVFLAHVCDRIANAQVYHLAVCVSDKLVGLRRGSLFTLGS